MHTRSYCRQEEQVERTGVRFFATLSSRRVVKDARVDRSVGGSLISLLEKSLIFQTRLKEFMAP